MDIQKLRQEFEKLPDIKGILYGSEFGFNESLNEYYHPDHTNHRLNYAFIMGAWMAWKAQTVPEGFVILKASDVREILSNASDAMDAESPSSVFTQTGIPSTWYDHHLVAEKNILDAIKAQEPTND